MVFSPEEWSERQDLNLRLRADAEQFIAKLLSASKQADGTLERAKGTKSAGTSGAGAARTDLSPFAATVDSGVAEVVRKQETGWSYVRSGS